MERARPAPLPDQLEPTYPTRFGSLTFAELYERTSRFVGYLMRESLGLTNPEDIDDSMQVGYLKLWQRLEQQPDWLADKPKIYIAKAVLLRSKSERFRHQRHYRKLVYDADACRISRSFAPTAHEIDTRMDLTQAIGEVALAVEDRPALLLTLYCLLTQAPVKDVGQVFGYSPRTLYKYRPEIRDKLQQALPGYAPINRTTTPPQANGHQGENLLANMGGEAASNGHVSPWRERIRPYTPPPEPSRYPTGWAGQITLDTLMSDPDVRRAALAKVRQLGVPETDWEDCLQEGYLYLWQQLQAEPALLSDKGVVWTGLYVAFTGNPKRFHRRAKREQPLTALGMESTDAGEYLSLGLLAERRPTHARWTREIDETIDVSAFISAMLAHYADDPRKLIALKAVTGAISAKEAAQQLGMHEKNYSASIGKRVRQEVQTLLPDNFTDTRPDPWDVRLARGEGLEYVQQVAKAVEDNQRLLLALYVVTTSVNRQAVAETFSMGLTCFARDIRTVKSMLACAYRTGLPSV